MYRSTGFSLIELMITVAIVAILAAVAVPSYTDYITRSKLTEAHANLSDLRVKMEQYYLDNRRYSSAAGVCGIPGGAAPTVSNAKYFSYVCASANANTTGDQTFTLTANGLAAQSIDGISFTVDQANTKATAVTGTMASKGYAAAACWVTKKPSSC